jgi:hypothetical protein
MFIGHFAVGFAAKRAVPRVSLGALLAAAQLADIVWPVLVLAGVEQVRIVPGVTAYTPLEFVSYPWSHSLLLLVGWGVLAGAAYRGIIGGRRSFVVIAALVVSHWVLDWLTHAPDMPLYPGGARVGLTLWNSVPGTVGVESVLFVAGLWLYLRATHAVDAVGRWALVALVATMALISLVNAFRPAPPPSVGALCTVALAAGVLFPAWGWWADRHRDTR